MNEPAQAHDSFDPVAYGEKWLTDVFERMNVDVDVEGSSADDRLTFEASGKDAEALLGRGSSAPKSVEAIQTLLSAALTGQGEDRQVFIDVGGRLEERDERGEHLEQVARDLGRTATKLGRSLTVAGLNSYERAIVHQALEDDAQVSTESEGQGSFRKLKIS
ncbi:MAG: protein jag, partial [Persicimonas sp.]